MSISIRSGTVSTVETEALGERRGRETARWSGLE